MKIRNFLIILFILVSFITTTPVTNVQCTCGLTLIVFCPGAFQCWNACKDYTAWYTVCVLNEGNGNHYCECFGDKKNGNNQEELTFLE